MQPIRGTLHSIGGHYIYQECGAIKGLVITADDDNIRASGHLLRGSVEVWPAHSDASPSLPCTPENYAHLQARLAAAEDNLAREVRSNEAAAQVRADLEGRIAIARAENTSLRHEFGRPD